MKVGITLLYVLEQEELCGALKSYVVTCSDINSLKSAVANKVNEQSKYYPTHKFLGLEDVFVVSGEVAEGELLGRTTFYELKREVEATKLLKDKNTYSSNFQTVAVGGDSFNVSLLYFNNNKIDENDSFAFSVITVLRAPDFFETEVKAIKIANSNEFLEKIINNSVYPLLRENISFLGIEDIAIVEENIERGGAYFVLYNKNIRSQNELKEIVLTEFEIKEICKDIFSSESRK